ncbi:ROK family transcriptional regulator [Pararhizobium sp. A13]|uniref:ROK family transcriptional regulator n=1 Tax=Pararhizobium sp. A13 TaxID=3133975 RepID=UPI00324D15E0
MDTSLTRQLTSRTVLRAVFERAPVSRAELARLTGISKQAMSEIVGTLEHEGWVQQSGKTQGAIGRSAMNYEPNPRKALFLGVDVGGTKVHAALADLSGSVLEESCEPTDARGGMHLVDQITRIHAELLQRSGIHAEKVKGGVVGIPGAVHPATRRLHMVPNIPGLTDIPVESLLYERLGFPVFIDNDVNLAAKGEQRLGHGKSIDNYVFIALGTGVGMGIVNEGRVVRGAHGAAGEISTLPVGADPFDSRIFKAGALESSVGSIAIKARYEGLGGEPGLTVRAIFDRASDPAASIVIDEVSRVIAAAIVAVAAVLDPQTVIFGGSVGARWELIDRVEYHLARCMPAPPACALSTLGSQAGLLGCISVALERFREILFQLPAPGFDATSASEHMRA